MQKSYWLQKVTDYKNIIIKILLGKVMERQLLTINILKIPKPKTMKPAIYNQVVSQIIRVRWCYIANKCTKKTGNVIK